jgi:ribonuclease BN (tRNA processing enzyme)
VLTHISPGTDKERTFAEAEAVFPDRISLAATGQEFDLAPAGALPL